jgi:hypothetical protein
METWYRRILEQYVKAPKMGVKSQKVKDPNTFFLNDITDHFLS